MTESGEECNLGDDGNAQPDAVTYGGCTTECKLGPHCGDGTTDEPDEQCDDGNLEPNDGCSPLCLTSQDFEVGMPPRVGAVMGRCPSCAGRPLPNPARAFARGGWGGSRCAAESRADCEVGGGRSPAKPTFCSGPEATSVGSAPRDPT